MAWERDWKSHKDSGFWGVLRASAEANCDDVTWRLHLHSAELTVVKGKGGLWSKNDKGVTIHLHSAELTVVKGKGGLWLKNDKGVTIHLHSADDSGLALSIGVEGFKIHELKPE